MVEECGTLRWSSADLEHLCIPAKESWLGRKMGTKWVLKDGFAIRPGLDFTYKSIILRYGTGDKFKDWLRLQGRGDNAGTALIVNIVDNVLTSPK